MKKKLLTLLLSTAVAVTALTGCGAKKADQAADQKANSQNQQTDQKDKQDASKDAKQSSGAIKTIGSGSTRVGSLLGPTSMGLVDMFHNTENNHSKGSYTFTLASQPTDIVSKVASGDLDIALVPANLAATLYNKTKGGVNVIDINTGNVLYCVTGVKSVKSIKDLAGKTVYTTGQGASPEYVLKYLLEKNDVRDVKLEFKSEATEVAAILAQDSNAIAVLPQPFVTVAETKNKSLTTAFSLGTSWSQVSDSSLVTGVTIVRKDFLKDHADAVKTFMEEHSAAVESVNNDPDSAKLVSDYGIIENPTIAANAIPHCSIESVVGQEMKTSLSGYLKVLHDANPQSVGGSLPADDFYYLAY